MAISDISRQKIAARAKNRCEYCLVHEDFVVKKHEPDHIVPRKHLGPDTDDNLAWACFLCNRHRGSDVAVYDLETGLLTPIFNPRSDVWDEHFRLNDGEIIPLTTVGRVTEIALRINLPERVQVRTELSRLGLYP